MRVKLFFILVAVFLSIFFAGCEDSATEKEAKAVAVQKAQYSIGQPNPAFDWSLERHLLIELYKIRNRRVATHAVWRSDYGMVEGDCPSLGFGLPYDSSLTNPLTAAVFGSGTTWTREVVEQEEPNGIFASKNTSATWVMCVGDAGSIEPVYVESKVTVFPGPVKVNYKTNRVTRSGAATVRISKE